MQADAARRSKSKRRRGRCQERDWQAQCGSSLKPIVASEQPADCGSDERRGSAPSAKPAGETAPSGSRSNALSGRVRWLAITVRPPPTTAPWTTATFSVSSDSLQRSQVR